MNEINVILNFTFFILFHSMESIFYKLSLNVVCLFKQKINMIAVTKRTLTLWCIEFPPVRDRVS